MDPQLSVSRRRLLQTTSVGMTLGLAGCTQIQDSLSSVRGDSDEDEDLSKDAQIEPSEGVVTQIGPSETEAQQLQQEVLQEAEEEEWSDERTREEINDRFRERVEESLISFRDEMDENDDITIEGIIPEVGVVLLDGTPTALITALQHQEFASLLPGVRFEDAQHVVEQSEEGGEQPPDPVDETETTP